MYCKGSSVTGLAEMKPFSRGPCGSQSEYHTVETMDPKKMASPQELLAS